MKIINITHTSKLGGAELSLLHLLNNLEHSVIIVLFEDGDLANLFRNRGFQVKILKVDQKVLNLNRRNWFTKNIFGHFKEFRRISNELHIYLKQTDGDVLHVNTIKSAFIVWLARKNISSPIIWHIRDAWNSKYLSRILQIVLRHLAKEFDGVIANSYYTLRLSGQKRGLVLPSPIQVTHCAWKYEVTEKVRDVNLLLVGRISPWKGQDVALTALSLLPNNFKLRIVGNPLFGETKFLNELLNKIEVLGIENRVQYIGFAENVCEHYQWANIALHTSVLPEPFGQVIIEAMSHGLPVIASNEGGPTEIIANEINGILISPSNPELLRSKILDLTENHLLAKKISSNAVLRAKDFELDKIQRNFIQYLNSFISEVNEDD